jgi:3-hydroxyacyl-[acyl-carrier-protein] dehydratase
MSRVRPVVVGVEDVKFRGQVGPGDRLILLGHRVSYRRKRFVCKSQALVAGKLVFEGTVIGMPI